MDRWKKKQSPKVRRRLAKIPDVHNIISRVRAGEDPSNIIDSKLTFGSQVEIAARALCFGLEEQGLADIRLASATQDVSEGWDVEIDGLKIDFTINPNKSEQGVNKKGHQVVLLSRSDVLSWATGMTSGYCMETLKDFLSHVQRCTA